MPRIRVPLANFQFGEVSPSLTSRTDTKIYNAAAKKVENFFLRNEGGLLRRFGTERVYEFDTTVDPTTCTITVSDYANIATGSTIVLNIGDTEITLEFEAAGASNPSSAVGNTHFVRAHQSNNTTADNIFAALNAVSGFTVANPAAAVVTVKRDNYNSIDNLTVISSDTTRLTSTNFSGGTKRQHRLVPFIFSDDERYIISLEDAKIRIFQISPTSGAVSLIQTITADTSSAALPFDDDILEELTYAQSGDIMFIAHQTFMIRQLVRTGLTAFEVSTFNFDTRIDQFGINQPYYSFHPTDMTLDVNASSGTGKTLTTSAAYFNAAHVGTRLRYHKSEILITAVASATSATGNIIGALTARLGADAIETTDGVADVEVTFALHGLKVNDSVTISNAGAVGGISANNINGARTIQEVVDENVFVVTCGANANASSVGGGSIKVTTHAPTTQWEEQSYSSYRGFPAAVAFHENRLWFAGTIAQPDGIWASKSASYFNFDVGDGADNDALDLTASIGEINTIRHIVSNRDLQIFSSTNEFYIPAFTDKPITPTNAQIKRQTPYGSSSVKPQAFDGATLFVQKTGSVVREYIYSDAEGAYVSTGISTLSPHLITDPVQMGILTGAINRPESYAFLVNRNGNMAIFTSNRSEERAGWSEFTTQGKFHSVCVIDDRVFFVVQHDKGGGTQKFILSEMDSEYNLDFSDKFIGSAGVFGVSSHFANGAVVDVVNGTDYLGAFTVAGGNVDVSAVQTITSAEIGYSFNVEAETLPVDAQVVGGPLTGQPRAINRVILDLNSTLSVSVNGTALVIRQTTSNFSTARVPITGKEEFRLLGYSTDPTVKITQISPLALQINGLVAEVAF
tara:strand:- start:6436 stop:9003 length:2568 start_codon:yes stop_codon:yes gene_type:complete